MCRSGRTLATLWYWHIQFRYFHIMHGPRSQHDLHLMVTFDDLSHRMHFVAKRIVLINRHWRNRALSLLLFYTSWAAGQQKCKRAVIALSKAPRSFATSVFTARVARAFSSLVQSSKIIGLNKRSVCAEEASMARRSGKLLSCLYEDWCLIRENGSIIRSILKDALW